VLLGSLCDGPIPRPEESYRLLCVSECDQVKNEQPRRLLRIGRRGKDYETNGLYNILYSFLLLKLSIKSNCRLVRGNE
jgi:hypothetical protein